MATNHQLAILPACMLAMGLTACGGGGGGGSDDAGGMTSPDLTILNRSVVEGDNGKTELRFAVASDTAASEDLVVAYKTADGTATAGVDYDATSGELTIAAGSTEGELVIPVNGDTEVEADETFTITFTAPDGSTYTATATIENDDQSRIDIADDSGAEGNAGSSDLLLTVSLDQPAFEDVTVDYVTADLTGSNAAIAGVDYSASSGTLTIPAGQSSASIAVPVIGDELIETNEEFAVSLSSPSANARLGDAEAVAEIVDDEAPGLPRLSIDDASLTEGDSGELLMAFSVKLNAAADGPVSVSYRTLAGSATAGSDYVAVANGSLDFETGATARFVNVKIPGDKLVEGDETFIVELYDVTGDAAIAAASATGTIRDNDRSAVSVADASASENGGAMVFTISVDPVGVADIHLLASTSDGSATAGSDYSALAAKAVTIPAGQSSTTLSVPLLDDDLSEDNETFSLQLSAPSDNASLADAEASATIVDNELPPPAQISIGDQSIEEGDSGSKTLTFTLLLNKPAEEVIGVDYRTVDGSAKAPADYLSANGRVEFAIGEQSVTFSVEVVGDPEAEANEQFSVELSNVGGNAELANTSASATILENDLPLATLSGGEADEGAGSVEFTVTLDQPAPGPVRFSASTSDNTATAGSDYTALSDVLVSIAAGQDSGSVSVPILEDDDVEPRERFSLTLSNAQGARLNIATVSGEIVDNDSPQLSVADASVAEGDDGTSNLEFVISLNQVAVEEVTVDYLSDNISASSVTDYSTVSGTATIAAGQQQVVVSVPIKGDTTVEADETLSLTLSNPSANAGIAAGGDVATGTIENDDQLSVSAVDTSATETDVGSVPLVFDIAFASATDVPLTLDWALQPGTASNPDDYSHSSGAASGTLQIAAGDSGAQISVQVASDNIIEGDETFTLQLSSSDPLLTVSTPSVTGTIVDDDLPELSVGDAEVSEGNSGETSELTFTISLSEAGSEPISVDYATADVTASAGDDYTANSGTLQIPAGDSEATVTVEVIGDDVAEQAELLTLNLSNPSDNAQIAFGGDIGNGTIKNDDAPTVSIAPASAYEGGADSNNTLDLIVSTSVPAIGTTTVDFATSSGPGDSAVVDVDYTASSGTASIAEGESQTLVQVPISGDAELDVFAEKTFTVTLSNASANAVLGDAVAEATIIDDDDTGVASTGISQCSDGNSNGLSCPQDSHPVQDGNVGRASFSYTKLDASGAELAPEATDWACVRDEVTGLIWEVKTDDDGLRDGGNSYSWFEPDFVDQQNPDAEPWAGAEDLDPPTVDNSQAYVDAVNAEGLCGASDWRLPQVDELYSLVHLGSDSGPAIDSDFFPGTASQSHWTGTSYRWLTHVRKNAWTVNFGNGHISPMNKTGTLAIRLVRGGN